jgi:hypothetical protein
MPSTTAGKVAAATAGITGLETDLEVAGKPADWRVNAASYPDLILAETLLRTAENDALRADQAHESRSRRLGEPAC